MIKSRWRWKTVGVEDEKLTKNYLKTFEMSGSISWRSQLESRRKSGNFISGIEWQSVIVVRRMCFCGFCYIMACVFVWFRVVLKKEIRRQRVLRDGKEETVITEDIHVVQEDETSPELDAAMHHIVDQFAGRTHSGESSVWPPNDLERPWKWPCCRWLRCTLGRLSSTLKWQSFIWPSVDLEWPLKWQQCCHQRSHSDGLILTYELYSSGWPLFHLEWPLIDVEMTLGLACDWVLCTY